MKCIQNPCQYKERLMNHGGILISSVNCKYQCQYYPLDNQSVYLGCLMLILVVLDKRTSPMSHTVYKTAEII